MDPLDFVTDIIAWKLIPWAIMEAHLMVVRDENIRLCMMWFQ